MHRRITALLAVVVPLLLLLNACAGKPGSSEAGSTSIKIAGVNLMTFSPAFLAKSLGYYEDEGLDVSIVSTDSGDASVSALLGGSVVAVTTGFDTPIELSTKGQAIQSLAGLEMATIYAFVGGNSFPDIPADDPQAFVNAMRGKRFGVAASGSTGDTIVRGVLREYGLNPDTDVTIIAVGTGAEASAALRTGAVDALVSYEPDLTQMTEAGVGRVVFDLRNTTKESTYSKLPTSTLQATKEWIDANPEVAEKLVRAVTRANNTLREDPDTALPALQELFRDLDPQLVSEIYSASRSHFSSDIPASTYDAAMKIYHQTGLIKEDVPYDEVVATQFADIWTAAQPAN
ncbi:ABC transporter substrate-binding protein [Mycolicibacterium stellerae]|uniref:ABC transporter substrate-binding protein n=1 Tax=Mycolicibacterium stellerae TaxID=2358193 RepID=UPI000F0BC6FE|nr:ABC transporter substrate-binding protein [Mycolicibacterium stellerae]